MERVKLRDLRAALTTLDEAIGDLRRDIAILSASETPPSATEKGAAASATKDGAGGAAVPATDGETATAAGPAPEDREKEKHTRTPQKPDYAAIADASRLQRLIAAKEKTMANLDSRLAVLRAEREAAQFLAS